jgi:undecaprenyl-diphosphatase
MSALEAIVLGIVQGLTEFLPISSTGHLRIVASFAGWDDPGAAFTAVTQLGTMAAVLVYFRHDLARVAGAWSASLHDPERRGDLEAREGWYLIVATVPIVIFGVTFEDPIETGARDLYLISIALIAFGFVMLLSERVGTQERDPESFAARDAVAIGFAQALALVPGVSRSGATISAGLFLGLERTDAARFSFLLSVPAVVLSGLFELGGLLSDGEGDDPGWAALIIATLLAFAVGYWSIAFLLRWLARHGLGVFVGYRVALGAVVLALVAAGAIS